MTTPHAPQPKLVSNASAGSAVLETALLAMSRAIKALNFYPPEHPRRIAEVNAAYAGLHPLLMQQELILVWNRDGCTMSGSAEWRCNSAAAQSLAREFLSRKVQRLTILPELAPVELMTFLQLLTADTQEIASAGGMEQRLRALGLSSFWINEVDLNVIRRQRDEARNALGAAASGSEEAATVMSDDAALALPTAGPELSLNDLLTMVAKEENEQRFIGLVRAVVARVQEHKARGELSQIFLPLETLMTATECTTRPGTQREFARYALRQIIDGPATPYLLQQIATREAGHEDLIFRLCGHLGEVMAPQLIRQLCIAEALIARKALGYALVRTGKAAIPALCAMLSDQRWYVVRNMITILGEIADPDALPALTKIAGHPEPKVRKELIRTLVKFGSSDAEQQLIDLLADGQPEIIRQTVHSLGILKSRAAVPKLLGLLGRPDRFLKDLAIRKEAVTALGRIGDRQATVPLLRLLTGHHWLARSRWLELKIAIAAALGQLADDTALPELGRLAAGRNSLGTACSEAIDNLERLSK